MSKKKRLKKHVKNWFIYYAVKYGYAFLLGIKRDTAFKFLQTLGLIGYYIVPSERKKTVKHLKMVYGDKYNDRQIKKMTKEVFINLCRNMADAFRVGTLGPHNIDNYVTASGLEKIDRALSKGKGLLALTGHVGNWELMAAYLAMKGYSLNVIGAPIYDSRIDDLVVKNRCNSGLNYIARGSATRGILRALKRKEIIGILMDQDSKRVDGVFVDFLGEEAYTPVGPVILAIKTGAPLLPMGIHIRKNNTHVIEVGDEIELKLTGDSEYDRVYNTLLCSKAIEKHIIKYPTQWVWMHRRWKTKRKDV